MRKLIVITAPLSSTQAERDGLARFLTTGVGVCSVVMLETWKFAIHEVDSEALPMEVDELASTSDQEKKPTKPSRVMSWVAKTLSDVAEKIERTNS